MQVAIDSCDYMLLLHNLAALRRRGLSAHGASVVRTAVVQCCAAALRPGSASPLPYPEEGRAKVLGALVAQGLRSYTDRHLIGEYLAEAYAEMAP